MIMNDFDDHKSDCALIELTCEECNLVYKRLDTDTKHKENICLRGQLRLAREESKQNKREIQKLINHLNEVLTLSK
jgi:hypothetical protein